MALSLHPTPGGSATPPNLQHLLNVILSNYRPAAQSHNTQLLNDVKQEIVMGTSMQKAVTVMSDLLATVVANSRNGEIHITAEKYNGVVVVEIQERNNYNGYALSFSVNSLAPDAAALGGFISIKGPQQKVTTISFSFPNNQAA
ncbi:MAG TPA: hypothetical protein VGO58_11250 [Chitinophagaceae bacterium]|jgi:hypothetical protein|nr:hypothetical protein [Chitinophagaceae bacterium]